MAEPPPAPDPLFLPKFANWCDARRLKLRVIAEALGCSHETARRLQFEFGNPRRCIPDEALMDRIVIWTQGEIQPNDFYPSASIVVAMAKRAVA